MTTKLTPVLATVLLSALLLACSPDPTSESSNSKKLSSIIWPALDSAVTLDPQIEARADEMMQAMTLEQKIAQMIQPEIRDFSVEDMRRYGFGSYLNGGGAFPNNNKHATLNEWVTLADDLYLASIDESLDGSTIPTMWGTDAVHGHNNVIGATIFPHNIGLGAANNPELIEEIAKATAKEVLATGIDWTFAPTVAVARNDRWGRTYESYSEDPSILKAYAAAAVHGLQGRPGHDFLQDDHVVSTVKHFLGDGGTDDGVDQGNTIVSEQELFDIHAQGYVGGISAGAQTVMASFNSWNGEKLHGHHYLLTTVLKERLGFDGFIVGDWLGHGQIPGCSNDSCPQAINAGLDMFMASGPSWKPLFYNTLEQARNGEIALTRIDDAVRRILRVKLRAGLFERGRPSERPHAGQQALLGHSEHRAIAQQAVRESLVLLKNNQQILPLNPNGKYLVIGDGANNITKQSGGWTLTWQGTNNENTDFPNGTSIWQGIEQAVTAARGKATLVQHRSIPEGQFDAAIVVFGEDPYAEGQGDIDTLEYQPENKLDLNVLRELNAKNIPVVSVFLSGRPLWVNPELNSSNAFVAAWLPGSEGATVSELLFRKANGEIQSDFSGKLSFSWPARPDQFVLNKGQYSAPLDQPLFELGYGLSYAHHQNVSDELPTQFDDLTNVNDAQVSVLWRKVDNRLREFVEVNEQRIAITSNAFNNENLSYRTVDKEVQEDARRIEFNISGGGSKQVYGFDSSTALDLQSLLEKGSIQFGIKLLERPNAPLQLGMQCETPCTDKVDLRPYLVDIPDNDWRRVVVPLKCLDLNDAQMRAVLTPFTISSTGESTIEIADIVLKASSPSQICE